MGKKDMIKMKLTPEEVALIENIRSMQGKTEAGITTEDTQREELKQKYWAMDEEQFMQEYRYCMGDEVVIDGVTESLTIQDMMEVIAEWVDGEEVEELWNRFVPEERTNEIYFTNNDHEELIDQLVDRIMDGRWSPEN